MIRRYGRVLFLVTFFFHLEVPASAVIKVVTPLKLFLDDSNVILLTKIDQFSSDRPVLVLSVIEDLKGMAAYRRLSVLVSVDRPPDKENHVRPLIKRLAVGQNLILFVRERGKKSTVFGFTNGSWFHMVGERVGKTQVAWSLISGEPLLRQTFKGTTAEMRSW